MTQGNYFISILCYRMKTFFLPLPLTLSANCVISSVLFQHNKGLKQRTRVTAQLQLRILFGKRSTVYPQGVRAAWPQRKGLNLSWLLFLERHLGDILSPLPWACPTQMRASEEEGMFVSCEAPYGVSGFSFVPFSWAFPFVF